MKRMIGVLLLLFLLSACGTKADDPPPPPELGETDWEPMPAAELLDILEREHAEALERFRSAQ